MMSSPLSPCHLQQLEEPALPPHWLWHSEQLALMKKAQVSQCCRLENEGAGPASHRLQQLTLTRQHSGAKGPTFMILIDLFVIFYLRQPHAWVVAELVSPLARPYPHQQSSLLRLGHPMPS